MRSPQLAINEQTYEETFAIRRQAELLNAVASKRAPKPFAGFSIGVKVKI